MASKSNGESESDPWEDFKWDPASEAQLQAIEASYHSSSSKRSLTLPDSSNHDVPRRRPLPSYADSSNHKMTRRSLPDWSLPSNSYSANHKLTRLQPDFESSNHKVTCLQSHSDSSNQKLTRLQSDSDSSNHKLTRLQSHSDSSNQKSTRRQFDSGSSTHKVTRRRLPNWSLQSDSLPSPCRINYRAKYQAMKFGGKIVYCKTAIEAEKASEELLDKINAKRRINNNCQVAIGFDIEWKPTFKRGETTRKAALMQICMDNSTCYVIHIIHSGIPSVLKSLLADNSSIKVGVCIANDAWKMTNDYDVKIEPLMDLSNLANIKLVGPPKKWSLSSLTETITCKELEKPNKIRLGNWEAEYLSKEQLNYAATDAFVSWYLYEVLNGMPDPDMEKENTENK